MVPQCMLPGRSRSRLDIICVPERQHGACGVQNCFEAVRCGRDFENLPDDLSVSPGYNRCRLTALCNVPHVAYRSGQAHVASCIHLPWRSPHNPPGPPFLKCFHLCPSSYARVDPYPRQLPASVGGVVFPTDSRPHHLPRVPVYNGFPCRLT